MVAEDPSLKSDTPIFSDNEWNGDPDGDITIELDGCTWRVQKDIVSARLPWLKNALSKAAPGSHVVVRPSTSKTTRPVVFAALLQFVHTNELPSKIWEPAPSFVTYVKYYFLAERFGMARLRQAMAAGVGSLSRHVVTLAERHCSHCPLAGADVVWLERQHLASFLDAVLAVEEQPWSAAIAKAMYDAGDRMKGPLARLPAFGDFVDRFPAGKDFAQAIGLGRARDGLVGVCKTEGTVG